MCTRSPQVKIRRRPLEQHLYHEIKDDAKVQSYLDEALPLIGKIVMSFNGLESALNSVLCEHITDRTDATGLLVLHKMTYGTKLDLFKRFSDDFHRVMGHDVEAYVGLVDRLKEAGRLRNLVVHADWESTEDDGYTYVTVRISERGMEQEYVQLSKDSLTQLLETVESTRSQFDSYWEAKDDLLSTGGGT